MLQSNKNAGVSQRESNPLPPDTYSDQIVILFIISYNNDTNLHSMDESSIFSVSLIKLVTFCPVFITHPKLHFPMVSSDWLCFMDWGQLHGLSQAMST